ncbi:hypothetical protein C8034_v010058 [Colletotrichum sidae]|uniref:Uncharacterized protein n=2 Tax=Colletotrichum orbiculare species complex TaxID=2707354 RepID=A0A4R8Q1P3_9PEZI|nr:hypothetical protein C8035_v000716 [Colletotrichum spinosum]TEA17698.1 hypothetical protein C8034_v010058 [Colletotrichum sidae]
MRATTFFVNLFATLAAAVPMGDKVSRQTGTSDLDVCEDDSTTTLPVTICTLGSPLCCDTTANGLTKLDCAPPTKDLTAVPSVSSLTEFYTACIIHGRQRYPKCCTLTVNGGDSYLCEDPFATTVV